MPKGLGIVPISAARALSETYKSPMVVVFAIHPDRENFTITTYGETKGLCRCAAAYGEQISKAVLQAAVEIQKLTPEILALPEVPAIWKRGERIKSVHGQDSEIASDTSTKKDSP